MTEQACMECQVKPATEKIYMDSDAFGADYLHVCEECKKIHFLLVKEPETFDIATTECEFNGSREYLWDRDSNYRVRLFDRTAEGIQDALTRFREGMQTGKLYRMF